MTVSMPHAMVFNDLANLPNTKCGYFSIFIIYTDQTEAEIGRERERKRETPLSEVFCLQQPTRCVGDPALLLGTCLAPAIVRRVNSLN